LVQLRGCEDRYLFELFGRMKKRIGWACAMVLDPEFCFSMDLLRVSISWRRSASMAQLCRFAMALTQWLWLSRTN
jgi:ABC-type taurine transport system ATPase subunit